MPKIGRSATTCSLSSRRSLPAVGTVDLWVAPMYLRGIPSPESVGKNAPGEERLSPATSIFKDLKGTKLDAATRDESAGDTTLGSLGARFWG